MDAIVTVAKQKDLSGLTPTQVAHVCKIRTAGMKVCVYGESGVGKTFLVKKALEGTSFIEVTSKADFSETGATLFFDDVEQYEETASRGRQIVVSRKRLDDFPEYIQIPPLPDKEMLEIAHMFFDGDIDDALVKKARGNIRNFLTDLDFTDSRDEFPNPRDLIVDLCCRGRSTDPHSYIGHVIPEHGFSCGIIHENYLDAHRKNIFEVAEWMSLADIQDETMYHGTALDTSLFSLFGVVAPAIVIDHTLDELRRPGSAWTKYNNFKMREKRYSTMSKRHMVDHDSIAVLNAYCVRDHPDVIEKLRSYDLQSADLDVMNHLALINKNKIKPRKLLELKKRLKSVG